jgi:hypothetical protein
MSFAEDRMRLEMKYVILLMQTDLLSSTQEHSGLLRTLMLRTASTAEIIIDSVFENDKANRELIDHLREIPQITSTIRCE